MKKINDIVMIETELIVPNPYQPRQHFDDSSLSELAASIKKYGILQPITVRPVDNQYELIMGERRYRASQLLELKHIPAIVLEVSNEDSAVVALIENLQRVDLSFIEEAESYKKLIEFHGITQNELSERVGKSQSTISNKLRILKLDQPVLDILKQENLTERHARALLKIKDQSLQLKTLNKVIKNQLNVKETENIVSQSLKRVKKKSQTSTFKVNYRIYFNTIKKAFNMIKSMSESSTMDTVEHDSHLEIIIKIPKS